MSHFCGLVILTPEYAKANGMDDSLAKYDEGIEMPEYRKNDLSDYDKAEFVIHYTEKLNDKAIAKEFYKSRTKSVQEKILADYKEWKGNDEPVNWERFYVWAVYRNKEKYGKWFKKHHNEAFDTFEALYEEKGEDWNGNGWRKDENGVWAIYSTYNPDSKWDWYTVGGRWNNTIKTKTGELVNQCLLGDIDLTPFNPEDYEDDVDWMGKPCKSLKEGLDWHYTKDDVPFCIIIDGKWYEKGKMGWWACVSNEKDQNDWNEEVAKLMETLPADSFVYNVDFHI